MSKLVLGRGAHESLAKINRYRDKEGSPCWLKIDFKLCDDAQELANNLAGLRPGPYEKSKRNFPTSNGYAHSIITSNDEVGEKEACAAVDAWYDQRHKIALAPDGNVWSQMIWGSTTHYGCGAARNWQEGKTVVVAFFYPPGNIEGEFDENITNWNHEEFVKSCEAIWHGGQTTFSVQNRNNAIDDQDGDNDEFWQDFDERTQSQIERQGNGQIRHSTFVEKSRVVYDSDEEPEGMSYYERAKLLAGSAPQRSVSRVVPDDEIPSSAKTTPVKVAQSKPKKVASPAFTSTSLNDSASVSQASEPPKFMNSYMREYKHAVATFHATSRVVYSDDSGADTEDDMTEMTETDATTTDEEDEAVATKEKKKGQVWSNTWSNDVDIKVDENAEQTAEQYVPAVEEESVQEESIPEKVEEKTEENETEKDDSGVDQSPESSSPVGEKAEDYRFKHQICVKGKFSTPWKKLACSGIFDYAGLTEFNEPHFKRTVQDKDVFLSLWGRPGKKKWRIGPDVASKVCWAYTKKRSPEFGVPTTGWMQSSGATWEPIDLKVTVVE